MFTPVKEQVHFEEVPQNTPGPSQYSVHSHFSSAKQGSLLPESPSE